jgi:four helix bundle protein
LAEGKKFGKRIYLLTKEGSFAKDFALRDQINRSSGSVMDNIAEGFGREGKQEFIQFLAIAKGSVEETRSQIHRAFDRNHIGENQYQELVKEAEEVGRKLHNFIDYLKNSDHKGNKYNKK